MKADKLVARLDTFLRTWVSNPAAMMEFVRLVEQVHQQPTSDHADAALLDWIDRERKGLRSIGIR